ncbi:MAG: molybdopterin/thiamine biosynthesis adenylyltransferase [Candidatus Woesearchaeota archaeon]|jgi:molybdopterin/thiamine biosynthesis adenylyltransferase
MVYEANISALGLERQKKLEEARIVIHGLNLTSEYLLMGLAGLGVKDVTVIDNVQTPLVLLQNLCDKKTQYRVRQAKNIFEKRYPLNWKFIRGPLLTQYIDNPHMCIDQHEEKNKRFATLAKNVHASYYATTTKTNKAVVSRQPTTELGSLLSPLLGAMLSDEIRKRFAPLTANEEIIQKETTLCPRAFTKRHIHLPKKKTKQVAIIGAGGIGTYLALQVAFSRYKQIDVYDGDTVEATNLNRQFLYATEVGQQKAQSLCRIMGRIAPQTTWCAINEYLTEQSIQQLERRHTRVPYDTIFCATDSINSRILISDFARKYKIEVIEGAVSTHKGVVTQYTPPFTKTIALQRDLQPQTVTRDASCARVANPSIIVPNMIVGAMMGYVAQQQLSVQSRILEKPLFYHCTKKQKLEA